MAEAQGFNDEITTQRATEKLGIAPTCVPSLVNEGRGGKKVDKEAESAS